MPVKVAQVIEATTGGTRRHLVDLCMQLDRRRFDVSVFCATRRDPAFRTDIKRLEERGISVTEVEMLRQIRPVRDLVALVRLYRRLRAGNFDVVHTHSSKAGVLGRLAGRLAGVPRIIHTPHAFPFMMDVVPVQRAFYRWVERLAARVTDRIVCVCRFEREQALAVQLCDPSKLVVVENGIAAPPAGTDPAPVAAVREQCAVPDDGFLVGASGRLVRQKGIPDLLEAFAVVHERQNTARLVIQGDGPTRDALLLQARRLGIDDVCTIRPGLGGPADVFRASDVVVFPSCWEGLPYTLLEAMAVGCPVVATRVGGMPEAVAAGPAGILVPSADPAALARAILDLLGNESLRRESGDRARALMAERYRLSEMVAAVEALYEEPLDAT